MSLWEKWEKEKMERMGLKVERKADVEIYDTHPKADVRKQSLIVGVAILACFTMVYFFWTLHARYSGHWDDLYIIRLIAEKSGDRMAERNQR